MIFYFSGTGNSQLAAKQIASIVDDEVVSINACLRAGERGRYHSLKPLVFVVPTYAWRIPKVVERWICETQFEGSPGAYFVLTCGGSCGDAAEYAKRLCAKKGLHFWGLAPVVMPENYVAMFPTPGEAECKMILEEAKPRIAALAERIRDGKIFPRHTATLKDKVQSGPVNLLFYPFVVHDKGFCVSDACISCGKCVRRCPLNNLELAGGKPVWKGNCTHCMACIGGCPVEAIEYKTNSKGKHKYYMMED